MELDEYVQYYIANFADESFANSSTTGYSDEGDTSEYLCSSKSFIEYDGEIGSGEDNDEEDDVKNENEEGNEELHDEEEQEEEQEDEEDEEPLISYTVGDEVRFRDSVFCKHFYTENPGFSDLKELNIAMKIYQAESR
jgi:hypothetical protein